MGALKSYDFSGWATKNDIKCTDGRTIRRDAFAHNDGQTVPLVWNHGHDSPENIIGRALLKNKQEGVYCYGTFNDTEMGQTAKALVQHGDISALSIYANHLKQNQGDVIHGSIREVSLVLSGANDGAFIDSVIAHGEEEDDSMYFYNDSTVNGLKLMHKRKDEDEDEEDDEEDEESEDESDEDDSEEDEGEEMTDEEKKRKKLAHADSDDEKEDKKSEDNGKGESIKDIFNTLNEKQKKAVYAIVGAAVSDDGEDNDSDEEDKEVKHNVFDADERQGTYLSHSDMENIFADAKRVGSLKEAFLSHAEQAGVDADELSHADTYGIKDIETLFPDAKSLNTPPDWIKRETDWVPKVLNGTHHTPFSRIKSQFANITEDEARAKGYIKGKLKKEEVFSLLKRTTDPTTIYKKQKLDRDDIIDITDFDVVAWIRGEMRVMLDEEIARAILIGDGRLTSDDDHIDENHIRPIWKDHDLYNVKCTIELKQGATDDDKVKAFIKACIKARKFYKGSGSPTMFTTEDLVSDALLLEDGIGHALYESEQAFATKCRVSGITTVPVMEGVTDATLGELAAIIVNLKDYNVGADKGGNVAMFDDFDIDYNQQKYLIETRCSGALIKPYSAITVLFKQGTGNATTITFSGNGLAEAAG